MHYVDRLISSLKKSSVLGERWLPNGALLLGHVPHIAPEAYLHSIFPGLDADGIGQLEAEIGRKLPESLKDFYGRCNGIHLFCGSLSIFGLRDPFLDGVAGDIGQPFSMRIPNVDERPSDVDDSFVFFGFYDWDGSLLYASSKSPEILRCACNGEKVLNLWPSLELTLATEVARLASLFDTRGVKLNEDAPTVPQPVP
jgi:hypothetical protein